MSLSRLIQSRIPEPYLKRIREAAGAAETQGLHPYLVGGIVRDLLLGAPFHNDIDLTFTGGSPSELAQGLAEKWKLKRLSYPQFQTFTLLGESGFHLDLITARSETYPHPAALPKVQPSGLKDDLFRRDFTVNAMAADLSRKNWGELVEFSGGSRDLKAKVLRVLHDRSFSDDPTRIFRAARYAARFGFRLEKGTEKQLKRAVSQNFVALLSGERLRAELEKIFAEKNAARAMELLAAWKVLAQIHPGFRWSAAQSKMIARSERSVPARMSLCLIQSAWPEASAILEGLKFSKDQRDRILQPLFLKKEFQNKVSFQDVTVNFLYPETDQTLSALYRAQKNGAFQKWIKNLKKWMDCRPILNGADLQKLGFEPGPLYREALDRIRRKKFLGKLKSRKDETRFLIDNFRRT